MWSGCVVAMWRAMRWLFNTALNICRCILCLTWGYLQRHCSVRYVIWRKGSIDKALSALFAMCVNPWNKAYWGLDQLFRTCCDAPFLWSGRLILRCMSSVGDCLIFRVTELCPWPLLQWFPVWICQSIRSGIGKNVPSGLVNQAATCYLNSLMQALFMTPEFRNGIYRCTLPEDKPCTLILTLKQLFKDLESGVSSARTKDLTSHLKTKVDEQRDVQEFLHELFEVLEEELQDTSDPDLIKNLYMGEMKDYVLCKCGYEDSRNSRFLDLPLVVKPFGSIKAYANVDESLRAFENRQMLTGRDKSRCSVCNRKRNAIKGLKLIKFPRVLVLQLMRFEIDYITMQRIKLNNRMEFKPFLDLGTILRNSECALELEKADDDENSSSDEENTSGAESIHFSSDESVETHVRAMKQHVDERLTGKDTNNHDPNVGGPRPIADSHVDRIPDDDEQKNNVNLDEGKTDDPHEVRSSKLRHAIIQGEDKTETQKGDTCHNFILQNKTSEVQVGKGLGNPETQPNIGPQREETTKDTNPSDETNIQANKGRDGNAEDAGDESEVQEMTAGDHVDKRSENDKPRTNGQIHGEGHAMVINDSGDIKNEYAVDDSEEQARTTEYHFGMGPQDDETQAIGHPLGERHAMVVSYSDGTNKQVSDDSDGTSGGSDDETLLHNTAAANCAETMMDKDEPDANGSLRGEDTTTDSSPADGQSKLVDECDDDQRENASPNTEVHERAAEDHVGKRPEHDVQQTNGQIQGEGMVTVSSHVDEINKHICDDSEGKMEDASANALLENKTTEEGRQDNDEPKANGQIPGEETATIISPVDGALTQVNDGSDGKNEDAGDESEGQEAATEGHVDKRPEESEPQTNGHIQKEDAAVIISSLDETNKTNTLVGDGIDDKREDDESPLQNMTAEDMRQPNCESMANGSLRGEETTTDTSLENASADSDYHVDKRPENDGAPTNVGEIGEGSNELVGDDSDEKTAGDIDGSLLQTKTTEYQANKRTDNDETKVNVRLHVEETQTDINHVVNEHKQIDDDSDDKRQDAGDDSMLHNNTAEDNRQDGDEPRANASIREDEITMNTIPLDKPSRHVSDGSDDQREKTSAESGGQERTAEDRFDTVPLDCEPQPNAKIIVVEIVMDMSHLDGTNKPVGYYSDVTRGDTSDESLVHNKLAENHADNAMDIGEPPIDGRLQREGPPVDITPVVDENKRVGVGNEYKRDDANDDSKLNNMTTDEHAGKRHDNDEPQTNTNPQKEGTTADIGHLEAKDTGKYVGDKDDKADPLQIEAPGLDQASDYDEPQVRAISEEDANTYDGLLEVTDKEVGGGRDGKRENPQEELTYELFAIIVHSGSTASGHYYSYIKSMPQNRWYVFNDSCVKEVGDQAYESAFGGEGSDNAYMLMYRKTGE